MNRRNFIYLAGSSLGALLFTDPLQAAALNGKLLQLPKKLFVTLDDGMHELLPAGSQTWAYKECQVKLHYAGDALQVDVHAPKTALHNIILSWDYNNDKTTMLGDHWERTYGDVHFQPPAFTHRMPWYFIQHTINHTTCFGVKTGGNTICYWQAGDGHMQLTMDTRNGGKGVQLGNRVLRAAEIVTTETTGHENTFATARRFCKLMCPHPVLPKQPVYGINDWYVTYGNNSADIILDHTARMTGLATNTDNRPFSVIDSGWAFYSPLLPNDCCWQDDYARPNEHFKDMHALAGKIKKLGMRPGLWTRPLCARHDDKSNRLLPLIPGRESSKQPVLDPSIAENLHQIKNTISGYRTWGYELVKHDYSTYDIFGKWGNHMNDDLTSPGWAFNDNTKTTAEIILNLYKTIRAGAGDSYLLGCNTISHLSAGLFELNRVGDDTSGKEWSRTRQMGVNTLGFRMIQHNNFYAADGDCVGLTTAIPWSLNKQWMQLLAESSTPLFISAQESATGAEQKQTIKDSFTVAAKKLPVAEPLDWLEQQWPVKWKLNNKVTTFNWDEA